MVGPTDDPNPIDAEPDGPSRGWPVPHPARFRFRWLLVLIVAAIVLLTLLLSWLETFPGIGSLTGRTWQWTEFKIHAHDNGGTTVIPIPDPEHYSVVFGANGTAEFIADCSRSRWAYEIKDRHMNLVSRDGVSDPCGGDSRAALMADVVGRTYRYSVWFDRLVLEGSQQCGFLCVDTYFMTFTAR